jgi:hypothetical protein
VLVVPSWSNFALWQLNDHARNRDELRIVPERIEIRLG